MNGQAIISGGVTTNSPIVPSPVMQIIAGDNVTIDPVTGVGAVTINAELGATETNTLNEILTESNDAGGLAITNVNLIDFDFAVWIGQFEDPRAADFLLDILNSE